jgi:hypothetical protein
MQQQYNVITDDFLDRLKFSWFGLPGTGLFRTRFKKKRLLKLWSHDRWKK